MNWKEKTLYLNVLRFSGKSRFNFPCCNDFILYLLKNRKLHNFKFVSIVEVDDISDIYVHDTLLQDFDLDMFCYGYFPVYKIMCLPDTVILQIDICDY